MTYRRLTGLLVLALTIPSLANAASTTLVRTLGHLLLGKGLSPTQARATAHSAAHHYHGATLQPILARIKGIPRLPARYYANGALKAPVAGGLS